MKNIIAGTAGHVDHGKTCLIKALTGIDTDRLKEEKKRGITIENGFADMCFGDYDISIIDVPGHEKFIKNMLAGIGGIDMVLLVIGLDEGVMPQTVEHLQILTMLDIRKGVIVFTKSDLVEDEEWRELVKEDVADLVKGTFLENAPMIEVSAYTGKNIEELKKLIVSQIDDEMLKNCDQALFRLPVDRVFTIDGFGTVVTGTLLEGTVAAGEEIMIYPQKKKVKVRNLQVHNHSVTQALAGQRTAINLSGIKKEELYRGQVLARQDSLKTSMMVDLRLELFDDIDKEVKNGSRVHFYCGSAQVIGKIVLLDRDVLLPGESCYAQLRLEEETAVKRGDRFIIRFYSPVFTIGGGKVLDGFPKKHKRFSEEILEKMRVRDLGSDKELLVLEIKERPYRFIEVAELASELRISSEKCSRLLSELENEGAIVYVKGMGWLHRQHADNAFDEAKQILKDYHSENALSPGMNKEEFKSKLMQKLRIFDGKAADCILTLMEQMSITKSREKSIALSDFEIQYSPEMLELRQRISSFYEERGYEMPLLEEVLQREKDKANTRHIIDALAAEGSLIRLDYQYYIDRKAFEKALAEARETAAKEGGFTLAQFRDIIGTSRKFALAILDYLDKVKITKKVEDVRVFL